MTMKKNPDTAERLEVPQKARPRVPPPSLEEVSEDARRRIRSKPSFFASLSPEARELMRNYDGPEMLNRPHGEFKL
jgi:hypothetical protein